MNETVQALLEYGYVLLVLFVFAEQVGLPVPAVPVLLGVGGLAGAGRMSLVLAFAAALVASLPPDVVWYELGRRRGGRVLRLLCRISLEPDSCVRRTENLFMKRGRKALLIAQSRMQRMELALSFGDAREALRPARLMGGAFAKPAATKTA